MDSNNILDLVLTTEADRVGNICVLEPFPECHHYPVTFEYVTQFNDEDANESASHLMWSRGNYTQISASIIAVYWITEFDGKSINESFLYFVDILQTLVDRYVLVARQNHVPAWMRDLPRHLAREKAAKWRVYKECRREFGRNHELSAAALADFIRVN